MPTSWPRWISTPRLAKTTAFKSGQAAREGSRSCSVSWIMRWKRARQSKSDRAYEGQLRFHPNERRRLQWSALLCFRIETQEERERLGFRVGLGGQKFVLGPPPCGRNCKSAFVVAEKRSNQAVVWRFFRSLAADEHGSRI